MGQTQTSRSSTKSKPQLQLISKTEKLVSANNQEQMNYEELALFDAEQLSTIPTEIWHCIICYLPINNFTKLLTINRGWLHVVDGEENWKHYVLNTTKLTNVQELHEPRFWRNQAKLFYNLQFSEQHIATGIKLSNGNKTVTATVNKSFAPVLLKRTLPMSGTIVLAFSMDSISSGGFTGVGVATDECINEANTKKAPFDMPGYIGQYFVNTQKTTLCNVGYFENGYQSSNSVGCGTNTFVAGYATGDVIKMEVNMDNKVSDSPRIGFVKFFKNGTQVGVTYYGIREHWQKLHCVVNLENGNSKKIQVSVKRVDQAEE
jgi:hypothetical protein